MNRFLGRCRADDTKPTTLCAANLLAYYGFVDSSEIGDCFGSEISVVPAVIQRGEPFPAALSLMAFGYDPAAVVQGFYEPTNHSRLGVARRMHLRSLLLRALAELLDVVADWIARRKLPLPPRYLLRLWNYSQLIPFNYDEGDRSPAYLLSEACSLIALMDDDTLDSDAVFMAAACWYAANSAWLIGVDRKMSTGYISDSESSNATRVLTCGPTRALRFDQAKQTSCMRMTSDSSAVAAVPSRFQDSDDNRAATGNGSGCIINSTGLTGAACLHARGNIFGSCAGSNDSNPSSSSAACADIAGGPAVSQPESGVQFDSYLQAFISCVVKSTTPTTRAILHVHAGAVRAVGWGLDVIAHWQT
jgi:hypothetical protein